jgi:hypothetical protein
MDFGFTLRWNGFPPGPSISGWTLEYHADGASFTGGPFRVYAGDVLSVSYVGSGCISGVCTNWNFSIVDSTLGQTWAVSVPASSGTAINRIDPLYWTGNPMGGQPDGCDFVPGPIDLLMNAYDQTGAAVFPSTWFSSLTVNLDTTIFPCTDFGYIFGPTSGSSKYEFETSLSWDR